MFIIFVLCILAVTVQAEKIMCPKLTCLDIRNTSESDFVQLPKNVCYKHNNGHPTTEIMANTCAAHKAQFGELAEENLCDFDLLSNHYAWVNEST